MPGIGTGNADNTFLEHAKPCYEGTCARVMLPDIQVEEALSCQQRIH